MMRPPIEQFLRAEIAYRHERRRPSPWRSGEGFHGALRHLSGIGSRKAPAPVAGTAKATATATAPPELAVILHLPDPSEHPDRVAG